MFKPGADGKRPLLVPESHFVDMTIKAANFDKVADYFGYTETNKVNPRLGEDIVADIKLLSSSDSNSGNSDNTGSGNMDGVFDDSGSNSSIPPINLPNPSATTKGLLAIAKLIGGFFSSLGKIYTKLFTTETS